MSDEKKHVIKAFHHKTSRAGLGHVEVRWVYPSVWKCGVWDKESRWAFVDVSDLSFDSKEDVNAFHRLLLDAVYDAQKVNVVDMPSLGGAFSVDTYRQS